MAAGINRAPRRLTGARVYGALGGRVEVPVSPDGAALTVSAPEQVIVLAKQ